MKYDTKGTVPIVRKVSVDGLRLSTLFFIKCLDDLETYRIFAAEFVKLKKFMIMKKRRITVFDEFRIIISIKNNTFLLNYLVNGINFATFAMSNPLLL